MKSHLKTMQYQRNLFVTVIILTMLFCGNKGLFAQQTGQAARIYSELKVGDHIPDYTFKNVINYSKDEIEAKDFKGKLLILDFWSTWCAACVESWPKLLHLQQKYKDKIQILLVNTSEDELTIGAAIKKRNKILHIDMSALPFVCKDTTIKQLFPHTSVPHMVWIDKQGTIIQITYGDALNEKNIELMINGSTLQLPQKKEDKLDWIVSKPLFIDGNGGKGENVIWHSVISKQVEGLPSTSFLSTQSNPGYQITSINLSVKEFYRIAYSDYHDMFGRLIRIPLTNISLDVQDTSKLVDKINNEYKIKNKYIYQTLSNVPVEGRILQEKMQNDINTFFSLKASWRNIKKKCLVLKASDTGKLAKKYMGEMELITTETNVKTVNVKVNNLLLALQDLGPYIYCDYPFVDETRYNGKIGYMELETNVSDYKALNKCLNKYGLQLTLEDREVKVLVVSDSKSIHY